MDHSHFIAEVDRITVIGDPIIRNLHITQCYHELSSVLTGRTGGYANWCTFATWASKQAGQTIRKEDLVRALKDILTNTSTTMQATANVASAARQIGAQGDAEELRQRVWEGLNPIAVIDRTSAAIARGNLKVFAEIGREFARFAVACLNDMAFDSDHIARFIAELRPGEPPEGQRYLRQAFPRYYQAFFESDPKTQAELMLLANLEIGLHEQTRLQPEIAEALNAPLVDLPQFTRRLLGVLFPYLSWPIYALLLFMRLINRPMRLDIAINQLITIAQQQVRLLLTEHMMVLCFPQEIRLRLGDDLSAGFPEDLKHITNPDLRALLEQIDPTPDSLRETGAVDWADLPDRVHFIVDLFRCYEETPALMELPFTPEQVTDFKAGRLPGGPL